MEWSTALALCIFFHRHRLLGISARRAERLAEDLGVTTGNLAAQSGNITRARSYGRHRLIRLWKTYPRAMKRALEQAVHGDAAFLVHCEWRPLSAAVCRGTDVWRVAIRLALAGLSATGWVPTKGDDAAMDQ
ncbi:hypothetical protein AQJ11_44955 [Streptomyces corchorusii]|uniref:Uncharacterized protein n=2 Tax=Streptomyces TaxID=1883 RepID=A0A101PJH4_STRCK|nr:hypothetical protein [Streptomyces corchorusii]KUN12634.1 hypothetical protein AQJ11_44955 [Streptomyces corchorusii]